MKVCIVNSFFPKFIGGAEYQARLFADFLVKMGHEVFFISYGEKYDNIEMIEGFKVYSLMIHEYDSMSLYYITGRKIAKILDSESPDFIYQRILNSFTFHIIKYIASNSNVKSTLLHIADNYSLTFKFNLRSLIRFFFFLRIKKFHSCYPKRLKIVCQSKEQVSLLERRKVFDVQIVNNMHPLPMPIDKCVDKNELKVFNIVWIGSARKVKQIDLYISLAQKYRSNGSLVFHIFGRIDLSSDYGKAVYESINTAHNIVYHGECSNDIINSFLSSDAYMLINTSVSEGFSNTFIQAWLRGVPVISLNSNPNNVFSNPNLGYYCSNSIDLLYNRFEALISDCAYEEKSSKAITYAVKNFELNNVASELLNLLIK